MGLARRSSTGAGIREEFDSLLFEIICYEETEIGVISVIEQEDALFLNYLSILPLHQSKGFGTQVLNRLIEQAAERGLLVKLNVMRVNPAKALYERVGFIKVGSDGYRVFMEWRNRPSHNSIQNREYSSFESQDQSQE